MNLIFDISQKISTPSLIENYYSYIEQFLKQIESFKKILSELSKSQLRGVIENMRIETVERGRILYMKGQPNKYTYVVLHGKVGLYKK